MSHHDHDRIQQQEQQLQPLMFPGFRFYPTEAELVGFYLQNKLEGTRTQEMERYIPVVDVYRFEPPQLPQMSGELNILDPEQWFFFCPRQESEAHGGRPTRTTPSGYWKATGSPSMVYPYPSHGSSSVAVNGSQSNRCPPNHHSHRPVGVKKTMVFYEGKAPHGSRTVWKMNEYRAFDIGPAHNIDEANNIALSAVSSSPLKLRNDFSLCRVYKRSSNLRSFDRRPSVAESSTMMGSTYAAASERQQLLGDLSPLQEPLNHLEPLINGNASGNGTGTTTSEEFDFTMLEEVGWDFFET